MKEFRKNQDGHFVCEECEKILISYQALRNHLKSHKHLSKKDYYDLYLKEYKDDHCISCGLKTNFISLRLGYQKNCSIACSNVQKSNTIKNTLKEKTKKDPEYFSKINDKRESTSLSRYNVSNISKLKEIKILKEKTCLDNYNIKAGFADIEKRSKTNLEKYGVEHPTQNKDIINKIQKTNLEKYGNKCSLHGIAQIQKRQDTWNKKYEVNHPMQNGEYFERHLKKRRLIKKFKDTNITYQGSYELDFLEKFYDKIDIENGPSITYLFEGKHKVYHSDFYIPSLNLVVEIKSDYILTLDEAIEEKKKAVISNSFNYILILNKDYTEFSNLSFSAS